MTNKLKKQDLTGAKLQKVDIEEQKFLLEDMKKGDVPLLSLDNDLSEEIPELQRLLNRSESPPNIGKSPIKDIPPQPNQTEPSEPRRSARSPSRTNPYDPEKEAAKPQLAETPKPRDSVADSFASISMPTAYKHLDTLPKEKVPFGVVPSPSCFLELRPFLPTEHLKVKSSTIKVSLFLSTINIG